MISLDYYYNSVRTDDPATTGQGLTSCTDGGLADMDCRLSWQLANRGVAGTDPNAVGSWSRGGNTFAGEWLVWKGGWMSLSVNGLSLDSSFLGEGTRAATASTGTSIASGEQYESWFDFNTTPVEGSFMSADGTCLIGNGGSECNAAYIKQMPALRTHYPGTSGGYDGGARTSTGYNDARFGLEVTGLSAEYDGAGVPGWMRNEGGSFTSMKIADNNGYQAGIAFGGSFYLYGF